ncbi:electron transfer flavoprotein-ubiquinone oxidoreductase, mitochondrial-like [Miscanthus floridulus]|uniref:electron transfer flavoprotein-ubiquinone oxidoreductase, mitochondrial-like n=1 Tax=Miscanthus floridulus TaxID=154761 RepID=UPI003458C338
MQRAIRKAAAATRRALSAAARASPPPPRGPLAPGWGATRWFCSGREALSYDVVIVGAGPAGLAAAIRLKQLCRAADADLSVCVLEKGSEVGAHVLSGNVFEPRALDEPACDIKDPKQNIEWTVPEGGGGPGYTVM